MSVAHKYILTNGSRDINIFLLSKVNNIDLKSSIIDISCLYIFCYLIKYFTLS